MSGFDSAESALDLTSARRIHLVGAGGAGMNAIGLILSEMGHQVSGSDLRPGPGLTRLEAQGARTYVGHEASNLGDAEVVAHSTAVSADNPELRAARDQGVAVLSRAELLAAICGRKRTLAVAGTHGKTTTSSMLALCLVAAGEQPSFLIGGEVNEIGSGAVWNADGEWFIVEADESDGSHLHLGAEAVLVTNVEADHLEHYGSFEALTEGFERLCSAATGPRVVCADDPIAAGIAERVGAETGAKTGAKTGDWVTYGTSTEATYRITNAASSRAGAAFDLSVGDTLVGRCELPLPGMHNIANAAGALAAGLELGAQAAPMIEALGRFAGVARRFERRGEADGVTYIDDYAHLPTEVAAAISAARSCEHRRVVAVFQPHRYSRVATLWQDFENSFSEADQLVLTEIYSAGEVPRPGVSAKLILGAVLDAHPYASVAYLPARGELRSYLRSQLRPGDLCLTLGAGDLTTLADELLYGT